MSQSRIVTVMFFLMLSVFACKKHNEKQSSINSAVIKKEKDVEYSKPAMNEFDKNEYFEKSILNNDTLNVILEKPGLNQKLSPVANKVKLEIKGYLRSPLKKSIINVELYSNLFIPNSSKPIIKQKLKITPENNLQRFTYFNILSLNKGLYYFHLIDKGEVIYTGKFQIN